MLPQISIFHERFPLSGNTYKHDPIKKFRVGILALEEEIDFEVVEVCKFSTSFKVIIMQTSNMEIYSKLYSELYLFKTLFIQNFIYLYSKRLRNLFLLLLLEILG
jgi:hypothetical protein